MKTTLKLFVFRFLTCAIAASPCLNAAFANVLTVTNLSDSGSGTLRDRLSLANNGDTINFAVAGSISLASQLTVNRNITISGPGAQVLKISGNNASRVFNVSVGNSVIHDLTISDGRAVGSTGAAGMNGQNILGGGVFVAAGATLSISNCVITNNLVLGGQGGTTNSFGSAGNGGNGYGGGIGGSGTANISYCQLVGNTAQGGFGGAAPAGSPGIGGQGWGGGVYVEGSGTLSASTINANQAVAGTGGGGTGGTEGGGIYNVGTLSVFSCTIVSNNATGSSTDFGGGVANNGSLNVQDCTIVGNTADFGGGVTGGTYGNTIIAGNSAGSGPDGSGTFNSTDYNFIQNTTGISFSGTNTHNITGQAPSLGPLKNNGGPTPTMAPLPNSPVIDKGKSSLTVDQRGLYRPFDTELPNAAGGNGSDIGAVEIHPGNLIVLNNNDSGPGSLRQAVADNDGLGGGNTIIFASNVTGVITLTSGELDFNTGVYIDGPGVNVLAISGNHAGRLISILNTGPNPNGLYNLTFQDGYIVGTPGSSGTSGLDGFDGRGGAIFNQGTVTIDGCHFRNNSVVGGAGGNATSGSAGNGGKGLGGAIYSVGGLDLISCHFENNSCTGGAGGNATTGFAGSAGNGFGGSVCGIGGNYIYLQGLAMSNSVAMGGQGGIATNSGNHGVGGQAWGAGLYSETYNLVDRTAIYNSQAIGGSGGGGNGNGAGGAIYNVGTLYMFSSTIANNSVSGGGSDLGGGIVNEGTMGITNSTIAANHAVYAGGLSGNANMANTILALNTASISGADGSGTITSFDYNLIQSTNGLTLNGAIAHCIFRQDPQLAPIADNGWDSPTMALRLTSPAVDKGYSFGITTDQRNAPRPYDFASIPNAAGGDGSDIGAFELSRPTLYITRQTNNVILIWNGAYGDFVPEYAPALPGPLIWTTIPFSPTGEESDEFAVSDGITSTNRFYRLRSR
jgi:hypothetical protein